MSPCDLLVLGELNPDVVMECRGEVAFGQVEQLVERGGVTLGSSGAITAAAAAAQGLRVMFCGVVGDDELGALTVDLLARTGVDVSAVRRLPMPTGLTVVLTRPDGDRALLTFPGTISQLRVADVPAELVAHARHVHVSSIFLQHALQDGLPELLRSAAGTTSLDPGWDPRADWSAARDLLPSLDFLLPNVAECTRIAGLDDPRAAAVALAAAGPAVAVKDGGAGGFGVRAGAVHSVRGRPVAPVDTTGAGDNFDAGFLAAVLEGASFEQALARAVASGSIAVTGWGGAGRMASRDEAIRDAAMLAAEPA